jgi:hypothetical protein
LATLPFRKNSLFIMMLQTLSQLFAHPAFRAP